MIDAWYGGCSEGRSRCSWLVAAAFAYVVIVLGLFERPLDERLGGPQAMATQSVLDGVWQVLSASWPTGIGAVVTASRVLYAVAVIVGAVVAVRTRPLRWIVVAYVLVAVLFVLAAGSDDNATKLATALWYKDRYRLLSLLPVFGVPLAVVGVRAIVGVAARFGRAAAPLRERATIAGAWFVAAGSAVVLAFTGVSSSVGVVFRLVETDARSEVVSRQQSEFFATLDSLVPAGQRVLGDPWDGSAWTWVFDGPEPVFPHVNGQWDPDRAYLAWHLTDIETDPAVCEALDRLRVRYVVASSHEFAGGDPAGNHFPAIHAAVDAGLFVPVASAGDTVLYRIDQCGDLVTS